MLLSTIVSISIHPKPKPASASVGDRYPKILLGRHPSEQGRAHLAAMRALAGAGCVVGR